MTKYTNLRPDHCFVDTVDHYGVTMISECRECGLWQNYSGPRMDGCIACLFKDFGTREQPAWVVRVKVGTRFFGLRPKYAWTFRIRT